MRRINKIAVLGSGVMGSGISAHFANIGVPVLMLDILPKDLSEEKQNDKDTRNALAAGALKTALKQKPAPFYDNAFLSRIEIGNFEDDFEKIGDCDWVIEVIIENLDIKKKIFEKVDQFRKEGSLITSNTSSIPIHLMSEGRSEDFQKNFCGTHFFNPVRYMRLLEVIPTEKTEPEVIDFLMHYGDVFLGKQTVLCKDTPAFIANRIGVFSGMKLLELRDKYQLRIEEVDALTGPAIARPKTGSFRLMDLVGLDTNDKVVNFVIQNCPQDEYISTLKGKEPPPYVKFLIEKGFVGYKAGQGFYKRTQEKDEKGKRIILALNLETLEYEPSQKPTLPSLGLAKQIEYFPNRLKTLLGSDDKGGLYLKDYFAALFAYVSNRLPEISEDLYSLDDAMRSGYAWDYGPFEYWDLLGVTKGIELAESNGEKVADWVKDLVASGQDSFYKSEGGTRLFYDIESKQFKSIPGLESFVILDNYRDRSPVFENSETILHDIDDGVLCLEFISKANSIGEGVLSGINEAISIAEKGDWKGLIIGNNAKNFSVGANLMNIAMLAYDQDFDTLNMAVNTFQQTTFRCRHSSIPVVTATQGYVFGGACEILMHSDAGMCAAESYIGLVEVGVGLLPGGGGTKEFAVRASDSFFTGDVMIPTLVEIFKTVAMGSVATSAHEAFNKKLLLKTKDEVVVNVRRNLAEAKKKVLEMAEDYTQPIPREDVYVLGRSGLAALYLAANELRLANYATDHDITIAKKIAYILCGGDLTGAQKVSEKYLLDIEREAFLSLCGEQKTLQRIEHMLKTNKPLRN